MSYPPPPPPPQGPPPPGAPPPQPMNPHPGPRTSSNAVVALVLAICSFLFCPLVPAVIALFLAPAAQREIDTSGGWVTGTGLVQAAKIVAWINIALSLLFIVGFVLVIAVASVNAV